ncbi:MAG: glycosyl transferase family 4, partial [Candidatus Methanomethylicota archaeon]
MKVEAYAKVNDDNSLEMPYDGIYDVTHLAIYVLKKIKSKVYERDVVILILAFEVIIASIALKLFLA